MNLDAENFLVRVSPEQRGFANMRLQQIDTDGHLATCDFSAERNAQPPEWQVSHSREGCQIHFSSYVQLETDDINSRIQKYVTVQ